MHIYYVFRPISIRVKKYFIAAYMACSFGIGPHTVQLEPLVGELANWRLTTFISFLV
jgi:hypothetical protein